MTETLLDIRDLVIRYGDLRAVDGVSLAIRSGEILGLVGESGCGKTSLAKAVVGRTQPESGSITLGGSGLDDLRGVSRLNLAHWVQMLHQDAHAALSPRMRVKDLLAEPLQISGQNSAADWDRLMLQYREIGLSEVLLGRYPHQLSGGQAKRVALLRALALAPRLLVADEPTAGLDLSVQGELLNLLVALKRKLGLTYLLISHNLNVIGRITDRVAVMYLGQIVETGATRDVFRHPRHPYTAALLSANPSLNPAARRQRIILSGDLPSPLDPPAGCRFHPRCPVAQDRCRAAIPVAQDGVACHFPLRSDASAATSIS